MYICLEVPGNLELNIQEVGGRYPLDVRVFLGLLLAL